MNDQLGGIIRAVMAAVGGFFLAKGWVSAVSWEWIVGGVATIGPAIWSWFTNRPSAMAATVQNLKGVEVIPGPTADPAVKVAVADAKASGA